MAIPGYVVPGQIICPCYEKVAGAGTKAAAAAAADSAPTVVRRYVPGHGVALSPVDGSGAGAAVVALTATLVGRVSVEALGSEKATASVLSSLAGVGTPSPAVATTSAADNSSALRAPRRAEQGVVHTFRVSVQDRFAAPSTLYAAATAAAKASDAGAAPTTAAPVTRESFAVLPEVGSVVLARVTKLTLRQANVEILSVEHAGSNGEAPGSAPVAAESGVALHSRVSGVVAGAAVTSAAPTDKAVAQLGGAASGADESGLGGGGGSGGGEGGGGGRGAISSTEVGEGFGGIVRLQDVRMTERDKVKMVESFRPGDIVRASVVSGFFFLSGDEREDRAGVSVSAHGVARKRICTPVHLFLSCSWRRNSLTGSCTTIQIHNSFSNTFLLDLAGRRHILLPVNSTQRPWCHSGALCVRRTHVPRRLGDHEGAADRRGRAPQVRQTLLRISHIRYKATRI